MAVNSLDLLLKTLDDLKKAELKRFKMYLSERTVEGCEPIPKGKLEDSDTTDVASLMKEAYGDEGSVIMTRTILRKMNLNNLADQLEEKLTGCKLTDKSCEMVASVLQSPNSLQQLDLSDNDLGDSGVQLLSKGLSTLRTDHASLDGARQCLLKYACDLTLDPNTAGRKLSLSEGNRKVTRVDEKQPYPEHPERFDCPQVLCREGLTGRCYWEAEWSGSVPGSDIDLGALISVAYKSIGRKGKGEDVVMGQNAKSWSLECSSDHRYSVYHNKEETDIPAPSSGSRTVGVYLDWPAGTLSFYSVSTNTLTHLHTFHSTFTEPLCPGFGVWGEVSLRKIT